MGWSLLGQLAQHTTQQHYRVSKRDSPSAPIGDPDEALTRETHSGKENFRDNNSQFAVLSGVSHKFAG